MEHLEETLRFSHKNYLCTVIYRIAHLCERKQNTILKKYGVTHQQTQLLAFIYARNGQEILQRDIEKAFYLKSSTVTETLNTLERIGLIERIPCCHDRRAKQIRITAKAEKLHEAFLDSVLKVEAVLKMDFSEEDQKDAQRMLLKMYENLQNDSEDARIQT